MRPVLLSLLILPAVAGAQPPPGYDEQQAKQLFETHCAACHSLDLPKSQRLNRQTWEWVMRDMVEQFGCTWLTEEQQALIVEYLAQNYSPQSETGQARAP